MGKQWKQWLTLFSWAPKLLQMVTTAMKLKDACSLEEELWTSLDSVLKSWDITLSKKICVIKAMVFPVVMYRCEIWTIKKDEHQRMMLLKCGIREDSWESLGLQGRPNQSILKEINPEYSLDGLMLKLKLQYLGHLMWRTDSLKKTLCWERLKSGGEGDNRGWDGWMASPTRWAWVWASSGSWWWTGRLQSMGSQRVGHDWATELNWEQKLRSLPYWWIITEVIAWSQPSPKQCAYN